MDSGRRTTLAVLLLAAFAASAVTADPETVEGLVLNKRAGGKLAPRIRNQAPAVSKTPEQQQQRRQQPTTTWKGKDPFPQARFGGAGGTGAFAKFLKNSKPPQQPQRQQQQQQPRQRLRTYPSDLLRKGYPQVLYNAPPPARASAAPTTGAPPPPRPPLAAATRGGTPQPSPQAGKVLATVKPGIKVPIPKTTTAAAVNQEKIHLGGTASSTTSHKSTEKPAPSSITAKAPPAATGEAKIIAEKKAFELPKAVPVRSAADVDGFVGEDRAKAVAGIVIGVVFVAVFVAAALALAVHGVGERLRQMRQQQGDDSIVGALFSGRLAKTPDSEDQTPPELRGCGAPPSFVQPSGEGGRGERGGGGGGGRKGRSGKQDCNGQHFFTGQLILHEAKRNQAAAAAKKGKSGTKRSSPTGGGNNVATTCLLTGPESSHVTTSLAAAHAAVMMPSPAEQVTDDLLSPKYDDEDDEEEDEEEDSDDTVYECPGLAAPGEMVVSNPFYLQRGDHLPRLDGASEPKPISQSSIFHHGIKGVN